MKRIVAITAVAFIALSGISYAGCGSCPGDQKKEAKCSASKGKEADKKCSGSEKCKEAGDKKCCGSEKCKEKKSCSAKKACCPK